MTLKQLRLTAGLSLAKFAALAGLPVETVRLYEDGLRPAGAMSLREAVRWADVLGVHPRELLGE